jgi:hypothetical protein
MERPILCHINNLLLLNTPPLMAEGLQAPWFIALEATDALAKA